MELIDIEYLRDSIKSLYDIERDYDNYEHELMNDLYNNYITKEEFEHLLEKHYRELEKGAY